MAKIGIKIISDHDMAKCIKIVRKYCNNSVNEIQDSITNYKCVIEGYSNRTEDILSIKKLYDELCQNKIETKLFMDDAEISENMFDNIIESHFVISAQTRKMMDQEADE